MADVARALVMFMGGMTIALKWPILRQHADTLIYFRRGRMRFDDVAMTLALRSFAHVLSLIFIIVEIGSRLGNRITWRTPSAFLVFLVSIIALLETNRRDRVLQQAVRKDVIGEEPSPS